MVEEVTDLELVKLAQMGDKQAFIQLIQRYEKPVYNLCRKLSTNPVDVDDIFQDTFVYAFRNIKKFTGEIGNFSSWLYRITVNTWKLTVRFNFRHIWANIVSLDKLTETSTVDQSVMTVLTERTVNPEEIYEQSENVRLVQECIDRLDPEAKMLVVLRELENKSYEDIAEILHCPLGTVKSRVSRARDKLKQIVLKTVKFTTETRIFKTLNNIEIR